MSLRISLRFRVALAAKGLLLWSLALLFVVLFVRGVFVDRPLLARVACLIFLVPVRFLFWTGRLAFADAFFGEAVEVVGVALRSRRAGYSLRLADGHFAEFILWNPWSALVPDATYALVIGRRSRVIVEPPKRA